MAKANITHREIVEQIRRQEYKPIYLLMGEEAYYIDRISEYIADNVLTKDEQDFNQTIIYCTRETAVADVINCARRYPMMAKHQVVIVKEAQNLLKIDELAVYAQNPMETTILVICYKNGKVDGRKKLIPAVEKVGVVFESPKLKDGMLPQFIADYLRRKQVSIEERACLMMAESVGADLNRMAGELDKLVLALPTGQMRITPDLVEQHVGISKEFNLWELRTAVSNKDVAKVNKIIFYFDQNPKANSPVATVAMLFNFFAQLMLAYYSPDRTERGMMVQLDLRQNWQLREYTTAMRNYTALKTMRIIGKLREADARLKGINRGNLTDADIMHELFFYILH
ncbi:MAG: DNA polymerase III subunit delta [Bacteroidaceae bacterium]|jgi:DNA polymerase-3 subunit delta|nr:DNA polymerase III subunit delta [Bacteroidaceae bacterium]MDD6015434.1 DNA polymerase III subunit delta [Prevotellaceae bacterium]MBR1492673.1 DNA polymerase III subunit delta [Bacteroidaceae bacterium]MBS7322240.1 DNA polymerase III subunit delta [Bacteroidaceae bacterium]MDD7526801.1 DNA polymerase III subunit delta [Prevotellaceae bacterium]